MMWSHVIVVVSVTTAIVSSEHPLTLEVKPAEPLVEAGSSLIINCTARRTPVTPERWQETENDRDQPISKRLQFYLDGVEVEVNRSTSEIAVLDDVSAQLTVHNVSRDMSGHRVTCRLAGYDVGDHVVSSDVTIRVAEKPGEVDINCVVYNWRRMNCTWSPLDTGVSVDYQLYFSYIGRGEWYACPFPSDASCYWSDTQGDYRYFFKPQHFVYYIVVKAANQLGFEYTYRKQPTDDIVKPDPVSGLSVMESNVTVNSATLAWRSPNHDESILFRVSVESSTDNSVRVINRTSIAKQWRVFAVLTNLTAFTRYEVTVDCIPVVDDQVAGFWSDQQTVQFTTRQDVPAAAPQLAIGSFHSINIGENLRYVDIYWQHIPERLRNGVIISSRVRYWAVGECRADSSNIAGQIAPRSHLTRGQQFEKFPASSVRLRLKSSCDYEIFVDAETTVGFNTSLELQPLFVARHQRKPSPPSTFTMLYNTTRVVMVWSPVNHAVNYTIYWCHISHNDRRCDGEMKWLTVPGDVTSAVIAGLQHEAMTSLQYAISAELMTPSLNRIVSSGMSKRKYCAFNINKRPMTPENVRMARHQEAESLTVEWAAPVCPHSGYISHYVLEYCRLDHDCDDAESRRTVKFDAPATAYVVRQLSPDAAYRLRIKSSSFVGESAFTDFVDASVLPPEFPTTFVVTTLVVAVATIAIVFAIGYCIMKFPELKKKFKVIIVPPTIEGFKFPEYRRHLSLASGSSTSVLESRDCSPDTDFRFSGSSVSFYPYTADLGQLRPATPEVTSHTRLPYCDVPPSYAAVSGVLLTPGRRASTDSWNTSGESSEQYAQGMVVVGGRSEDVQVSSTLLTSPACDSHDGGYVSNIVFDADEDYEEDADNDLAQTDDVVSSSSLVVESSPYLDAVIHSHDVESLYSVVRPRDQS